MGDGGGWEDDVIKYRYTLCPPRPFPFSVYYLLADKFDFDSCDLIPITAIDGIKLF